LYLLEGDFPGAPTYDSCTANPSGALQTLHARDQGGRFLTLGRDSSATASSAGTAWDTIDRCDGTLTIVRRGTVVVFDAQLDRTITVNAGQRYLAHAP